MGASAGVMLVIWLVPTPLDRHTEVLTFVAKPYGLFGSIAPWAPLWSVTSVTTSAVVCSYYLFPLSARLIAFCAQNFNTEPRRDAQSATLQLLSSLSRQFESDELHIAFDHGVKLAWESDGVDEGRPRSDHHAEGNPAACGNQEGQLSLTRLLSKFVVACKQVLMQGGCEAAEN